MIFQREFAALLSAFVIAGNTFHTSAQAYEASTESPASRYTMAAVVDRASGDAVVAGNYEKAIEFLDRKSGRYFAASTNLCVAYTMTGELEKADRECDAALKVSKSSAVRRDIAVALSNLGVVKAVSGDVSGARQNFKRALEFSRKLSEAGENLRILRETHASGA